ncbi:MAG: transcription antitermination factor NusB [Polyangiaceae bacterium]
MSRPVSTAPLPDARRLAAYVVERVLTEEAWAAAVLRSEIDRYPQLDARDRGLCTELTYGTLRTARYLESRLSKHSHRGLDTIDATTRSHLLIGAYQLLFLERVPAHAAVSSTVAALKTERGVKVGSFANAILRRIASEVAESGRLSVADAVFQGSPRWLRRALGASLGDSEIQEFLSAGPFPPPIGLRVRRGDRETWMTRLQEALPDAEIFPGKVEQACILLRGAGDPRRWPGIEDGSLVIQEEGSQKVASFLNAQTNERVLDACAGRGHKSLSLADRVGPDGRVEVADVDGRKLDHLTAEAEQIGVKIRAVHEVDLSVGLGSIPEAAFDRVLVDAPCSGLGTVRRRPEILLRRKVDQLAEITALQTAILNNAARAVRPGGELVHAGV